MIRLNARLDEQENCLKEATQKTSDRFKSLENLLKSLFVPLVIAKKLVENKGHREYIGGIKKDIHEANAAHLLDAEKAFLEIAKEKSWSVIDCAKDGKILPIEAIHGLYGRKLKRFCSGLYGWSVHSF